MTFEIASWELARAKAIADRTLPCPHCAGDARVTGAYDAEIPDRWPFVSSVGVERGTVACEACDADYEDADLRPLVVEAGGLSQPARQWALDYLQCVDQVVAALHAREPVFLGPGVGIVF